MRIMGIDYGDSRTGIALSDPFGWTAQGLETIRLKGDMTGFIDRIKSLVEEYKVDKIVVGFPRNMNGTIGPRGEKTEKFINLLKSSINDIEVVKWDERLTTVAANRAIHDMGMKTSKKKGMADQIAAVYILQGYLDSINVGKR